MPCRHSLFLVLLFAAVSQGLAASDDALEHEARFRAADSDSSRSLNRAEVEAGMPKVIHNHFTDIDLDGDDEITPEELQIMAAQQLKQREQRRAERLRRMQRNH
ncbi:MAG: hypothetical protein ACSHXK_00640 [Oceanococcus sp.]